MAMVGVLALQGDVSEHMLKLRGMGVSAVAVKNRAGLGNVDALIIPGGESTAISRLIHTGGLFAPIKDFARDRPVLGTCAGLIMCSREVPDSENRVTPLGLIDICVTRNGFGRQIDSFETLIAVEAFGQSIPAVFIRAPFIQSVGSQVTALAHYEDKIVMAEQGNILVCAFHPELTADNSVFNYFVNKITTR
ncbi:pyridoxal 5'-phosphate synthase glutaminase subunit PdxT [Martelella alba]|uniref:Pyridoxal 5'-phosphate synthase subunit PdxT n=1 Tax=Martelella alba TaxID=2590451 RepID=A0ABY2SHD9_9HYPH|nr:pyridoxal 5'-phosphate synthase glutaminase subunit PdxT [Martelella alba]TKI04702.1 pyridoxal 5'-phosphate synthase glutaminase subunit PdxT [Martelella alba]